MYTEGLQSGKFVDLRREKQTWKRLEQSEERETEK